MDCRDRIDFTYIWLSGSGYVCSMCQCDANFCDVSSCSFLHVCFFVLLFGSFYFYFSRVFLIFIQILLRILVCSNFISTY